MILSPHPNILIVGDTGDGKSALCGELAEHIYKTQKKKTRLYNCDRGWETLGVYIELGIIEAVPLEGNPLLWINHAVQGHVKRNDKWVQDYKAPDGTEVGLYLFESMTALGDWRWWGAQLHGCGAWRAAHQVRLQQSDPLWGDAGASGGRGQAKSGPSRYRGVDGIYKAWRGCGPDAVHWSYYSGQGPE
jgi:hypothetical protein